VHYNRSNGNEKKVIYTLIIIRILKSIIGFVNSTRSTFLLGRAFFAVSKKMEPEKELPPIERRVELLGNEPLEVIF